MAQLRNILLQNDVEYSSSAKKADLVSLFNANIKPTATRRLEMIENVEPNDDGIEVVHVKRKTLKKTEVIEPQIISISDDDNDNDDLRLAETKKLPKKVAKVKSPAPESKPSKTPNKRKSKEDKTNSDLESEVSEFEDNEKDEEKVEEKVEENPRSRKSKRVSSKAKSVEPTSERLRSRSPRKVSTSRKAAASPTRVTRSVSSSQPPSEKSASGAIDTKRDRSPIRRSSRRAKSEEPSQDTKSSEKSIIESDVEHFQKSPATENNIFQKSNNNLIKIRNPKKRTAEDDDRKQVKHQQTKPLKPTLFSEPEKPVIKASPKRSALSIDKFEKPTSTEKGDLFDLDDETLENALMRSPARKTSQAEEVKLQDTTTSSPTIVTSKENEETPIVDTSKNSYDITEEPTPSVRKQVPSIINHIIPSTIEIKPSPKNSPQNSPKVKKVLQFQKFTKPDEAETTQESNSDQATITEDTHELLKDDFIEIEKEFAPEKGEEELSVQQIGSAEAVDEEDEDQEDSIFKNDVEDEINAHPNDQDIQRLQNEIKLAEHQILKEAEQAANVVNQVLEAESEEQKAEIRIEQERELLEDNEDGEMDSTVLRKPLTDFQAIVDFFKSFFFLCFFIFIAIGALWYREQRILVGYCGSEIYQPSIPNASNDFSIQINDFLDEYKPTCLPCPENAICLPSMQLKCKAGYVVKKPWYEVYGLLPFSDYCVKDTKKEQIIREVVAKSLELLRLRNANYKCGDGNDGEDLDRIGISDEELYEFFFRTKKSTISDHDFNELWDNVLTDLSKEPEITVRQVILNPLIHKQVQITNISPFLQLQHRWSDYPSYPNDDVSSDETTSERPVYQKTIYRSTSTAKLSVHCKFQKDVSERFEKYKTYIISIFGLISLSVFIYIKLLTHLNQKKRIHEICEVILGKLMRQQRFAINDATGVTHRYLSTISLRDELLANLSNSKRVEIWSSILKELENNSNVRSMTKEIHGEIVRVLEWIGE